MKRILLTLPLLFPSAVFAARPYSYPTILNFGAGTAETVGLSGYSQPSVLSFDLQHNLTDYFGIALGYRQYGEFKARGLSKVHLQVGGPALGAVANLPLGPRFALYAKAEAMRWTLDASIPGGYLGEELSLGEKTGTSLAASAGLRLGFGRRFGVFFEGSRLQDVSGTDIQRLSLGWYLRF